MSNKTMENFVDKIIDITMEEMCKIKTEDWDWDRGASKHKKIKEKIKKQLYE